MNHQNMETLAQFLRKLPAEQFDMSVWSDDDRCGTVACVAGWATEFVLVPELTTSCWEDNETGEHHCEQSINYSLTAQNWLGLNGEQAYALFRHDATWRKPWEAADEIDRLIAADKSEWAIPDIVSAGELVTV